MRSTLTGQSSLREVRWTALPLAAGALLAAAAHAQAPFAFDAASGRLPKNVVPLSYDVAVTPDAAHLSLEGTESVQLRFRSPTDRVQFNSLKDIGKSFFAICFARG